MNPREQGDLGERSAVEWLWSRGHPVFVPFGHSADVDLMTVIAGRPLRVQMKTSGFFVHDRWKDRETVQRRALRPAVRPRRRRTPLVHPCGRGPGHDRDPPGGPKYAAYEVERGRPFVTLAAAPAG